MRDLILAPLRAARAALAEISAAVVARFSSLERAGFRRHRIERGTSAYANFLYVRPGSPPS